MLDIKGINKRKNVGQLLHRENVGIVTSIYKHKILFITKTCNRLTFEAW